MRLRNDPNAIIDLENSAYLYKEESILLNKNVTLEIGMGKGEMITQLAKENPSKFFIGIEKFATVAKKAMLRAQKENIDNFKIVCDDLINLSNKFKGKVDVVWLTFSDPWPKARHSKRRLTYKSFLNIYKDILSDDGILKFKTDNDKLFNWSVEHLKEEKWTIKNITNDFHNSNLSEGNIMTGYEKKWSDNGKNINYLEAFFKK